MSRATERVADRIAVDDEQVRAIACVDGAYAVGQAEQLGGP